MTSHPILSYAGKTLATRTPCADTHNCARGCNLATSSAAAVNSQTVWDVQTRALKNSCSEVAELVDRRSSAQTYE